ncbi:hypothetical protein KP806_02485 [Paenibacillus sp. N4]|uniref:hypothetical protein n=1 Tax=Paenibacillus vietnamensis TaxID=2590547 RepID=UPI001CD08EF7|nr:hypothetical protein [Paenibacillus vietnamensis]MCA0753894.1 hypothetical protein [Paenibacillus vietnamensis]
MNQFSQQSGNFQGQQSFLNQGNQFQPTGFVQSHYQGQLSQPTFGRQTNSIVSNQPSGYQSSFSQGAQHFAPSSYSMISNAGLNQSYTSHQPVQSHAASPATAFGSVGPVISHVGYQAGPDNSRSFYQPSASQFAQSTIAQQGAFGQGMGQSSYGPTPTHSYTNSAHPVYDATNAYQQSGPVISHVGWQSSQGTGNYR